MEIREPTTRPLPAATIPAIRENSPPPMVSRRRTISIPPAKPLGCCLNLPSIFYLLHIIPYLRVHRLTQGSYIQNNFHGLFLLLWSINIQLRLVHPPWMVIGESGFHGWEWAVATWAVGWYQEIWGEDVTGVGWLRKFVGKKIVVSENWESPGRFVSALDGKDLSKLFGTAAAPGPAEPWVVTLAEVVALVGLWIPAMCFLSFWSGESNSGLIHAVLNVFALWMDVYYRREGFGYFLENRMPGPALPLKLLMDRWTSDVFKVIIAYGLLRSLCRATGGGWRGIGVYKKGGFETSAQDEDECNQEFKQEVADEERRAAQISSFGEFGSAPECEGNVSKEDEGQNLQEEETEVARWLPDSEVSESPPPLPQNPLPQLPLPQNPSLLLQNPPPLPPRRQGVPPRQIQPIPAPRPSQTTLGPEDEKLMRRLSESTLASQLTRTESGPKSLVSFHSADQDTYPYKFAGLQEKVSKFNLTQDIVNAHNERKWKWVNEEVPPDWDSAHWYDTIEGDEVHGAVEWAMDGNLDKLY